MESGNNSSGGSLPSSSGGDEGEYSSRAESSFLTTPPPPLMGTAAASVENSNSNRVGPLTSSSKFGNTHTLPHVVEPLCTTYLHPSPSPSPLDDIMWSKPLTTTCFSYGGASRGSPVQLRNPKKKRSRASRRAPTTVLTTDTANFRAMVQEFTGIPAQPFTPLRSTLLLPDPPPYLLRPFASKPFTPLDNFLFGASSTSSSLPPASNLLFQPSHQNHHPPPPPPPPLAFGFTFHHHHNNNNILQPPPPIPNHPASSSASTDWAHPPLLSDDHDTPRAPALN